MAVTVISQPSAYTPAFNPQFWVASSNQTAQPNFRYRVILTDLITSETVTKDMDADPVTGRLELDSGSFSENFCTQVNPSGLYGFQKNTGAIRKIRVNIGEVYGATPTYFAGANTDYIIWNAALDFLEFQNFDYTDYLYTASPNIQYICNDKNPEYNYAASTIPYRLREKTMSGHSSYLYCLNSAAGDFEKIEVVGFDAAGNTITSTTIGNINLSGSTTYTDKYQFIDIGYDGLVNVPQSQVISGTYPIPVSTYASYLVRETSTWIGVNPRKAIKYFDVVCEPRYDSLSLHYLTPEGDFATQLFTKLKLRKSEVNKSYYSKIPYEQTLVNGNYTVTYSRGAAIENTLSSTIKDSITVHTDWLEEYEVTRLKDAASAPVVYVSFGDGLGFVSMKIKQNSFEERRKYNEQLLSVSFDLEYTHVNVRQKG